MTYQPLFIIGAGRSGTNILRDTLTSIQGWETWRCDEINLIWRHGNSDKKHDLFDESDARPDVVRYLRGVFDGFAAKSGASVVVEKTCANSLRVPFIQTIFPNARFIYIVRDGRDVALSAAKRWKAPVEMGYLLKKIKFVPKSDIPRYGLRFIKNRVYQMRSNDRRQAAWGPRFPGIEDWARERPLIEVCAKQWTVCVEESDRALQKTDPQKLYKIRYEDMVADPYASLEAIAKWAGIEASMLNRDAIGSIRTDSSGGWKSKISQFTPEALQLIAPMLERHGYEPSV